MLFLGLSKPGLEMHGPVNTREQAPNRCPSILTAPLD
jgi:hypothetical protein